jgi:hypothetical protein
MTDNFDFFINYNSKRQTILDKYKKFNTKEYYVNREQVSSTENSFVFKINYKRDASTFSVISKVLNNTDPTRKQWMISNLVYELYVGRGINIIKQYFPNFVHTIGVNLGRNPYHPEHYDDLELDNIYTHETYNFDDIRNIENGCIYNYNNSLMTEYLPNSNTYFNMLRHHEFMNPVDMEYNLFTSLFQIYAALYSLRNIMTHQDLHLKNVMIVTLPQKVNIVYTINEREYVLITKYIPVFIDYSSNHLNLDRENNSQRFVDNACKTECNFNIAERRKPCKLNGINNNDLRLYTPKSKGSAKSVVNLNRSIDIYFVGRIMYPVQGEGEGEAEIIPEDLPLRVKFKELFNKDSNPDWFETSKKSRVITTILKEYDPSTTPDPDPFPNCIRYTSDVMTKFLIPYYNDHFIKEKSPILNTINIDCNFGRTKWSHTSAVARSGPELLAILQNPRPSQAVAPKSVEELEASLMAAQAQAVAPIRVEEIEAGLRPSQAVKQDSFKPLTIAPGRFNDNIAEFIDILRTIEIRPRNPISEGGSIDAETFGSMELLREIKSKTEIKKRDIQALHRLFFNLTDKAIIIKDGRQISKEQIYKIMNDLFNYSAAVSVPGRRGGYYEKYMKYKKKYIHLKNELLFRNR